MFLNNLIYKKFFNSARFLSIKKNLFNSIIIKFFSIFFLFGIPKIILLNFTSETYGIFLTLISLSAFFYLFDLGLGNNLRNNITRLNIIGNKKLLNEYISTTYFLLISSSALFLMIFFFIKDYLDWSYFFRREDLNYYNINDLVNFFIIYSVGTIILRNFNQILLSRHTSYLVDVIDLVSKLIFFLALLFTYLYKFKIDINFLLLFYILSQLITYIISNLIFFIKFKAYIPNFRNISFKKICNYLNNSIKFFILNLGAVIFFYSDKIIISKLFSNEDVANFFLNGQIYFLLLNSFNLLTTPLWSSYTEAYYKKDIKWIKISMKIQLFILILFIFLGILIFIFSDLILKLWLGTDYTFDQMLSFSFMTLILLRCLSTIFVNFLNGISELKSQIYISAIVIFFNIPLSLFFVLKLNLGLSGVVYGSCICVIISIIFQIKIFNNKLKK